MSYNFAVKLYGVYTEVFYKNKDLNIIEETNTSEWYWPEYLNFFTDFYFWFATKMEKPPSKANLHEICQENYEQNMLDHFDDRSSHIEVVDTHKQLYTMYFQIDPTFLHLTEIYKNQIWEMLDTQDAKSLLTSMVKVFPRFYWKFKMHKRLDKIPYLGLFYRKERGISNLLCHLIYIMVILLIFSFRRSENNEPDDPKLGFLSEEITKIILYSLGTVITCFLFLIALLHVPIAFMDSIIDIREGHDDDSSQIPDDSSKLK
jgi:hypothetical protein